jgi:hypothetical protein
MQRLTGPGTDATSECPLGKSKRTAKKITKHPRREAKNVGVVSKLGVQAAAESMLNGNKDGSELNFCCF